MSVMRAVAPGLVFLVIVSCLTLGACSSPSGPSGGNQVKYRGTAVQGDQQVAPAGATLPTQLIVHFDAIDPVTNQIIGPVANAEVDWGGGSGILVPASLTTNSLGEVTADWTLAPSLGSQRIVATLPIANRTQIGDAVIFTATAVGGQALSIVSGDAQAGVTGQPLTAPLVVLFSGNGLPIFGEGVSWAVASGGGSLSAANTSTDQAGHTSVLWTLGSSVGPQTVTATAALPGGGSSVVFFNATAAQPSACGAVGGPGTDHPGGSLTTNETWDSTGNPHRVINPVLLSGFTLTVGPGTVVCLKSVAQIQGTGSIHAVGTAAAPILFTALDTLAGRWGLLSPSSPAGDTSYFIHTRIEYGLHGIFTNGPVILDSTVIRQIIGQAVVLGNFATGSRILRSRIDTVGGTTGPVVNILASDVVFASAVHGAGSNAISVTANRTAVSLDHCEVTGGADDGVLTDSPITIHYCNFSGNGLFDVQANSGVTVTADSNWWGNAGGPTAAGADGVSGNVNYTPFLTAPLGLAYGRLAPSTAQASNRRFGRRRGGSR
jgi:hypothetical protein